MGTGLSAQEDTVLSFTLALAAVLGTCLVGTLGYLPPRPLFEFRPDDRAVRLAFAQSAGEVQAAYEAAVRRRHDLRLIAAQEGLLYLDVRPGLRLIRGETGMALRLAIDPLLAGTRVTLEAQSKTWGRVSQRRLAGIEASLRESLASYGVQQFAS